MVFAVALVISGCSSGHRASSGPSATGSEGPTSGGVFRLAVTEPAAIDPTNAFELKIAGFLEAVFEGLVTFDENPELRMRPGVAERWFANADCSEWTFRLRTSSFSNGEPVIAESFVRGWTRAADGRAASRAAYVMAGVQGYDALHGTKESPPTTTGFSGLSAPDPHTFVVKLSDVDCEFDKKALHPVMSPVPVVAGPFDNKSYNEAPVGNGAFMIKPGTKWEHDKGIRLVRNNSYYGPKPHLDGVEFMIVPSQGGLDAAYKAFQAGDLDFAIPPPGLLRQAEATFGPQGGVIKKTVFGTVFLRPNLTRAPMAHPEARRAVALAVDREGLSRLLEGSAAAATALFPPPFGVYHRRGACEACRLDHTEAKAAAARAALLPGTRLKLISHPTWRPVPEAVKDMLERNLGIAVELEELAPGPLQDKITAGDFDLLFDAWVVAYPTPEDMLFGIFGARSSDNSGRYNNPELDELIRQTRREKDEIERAKLLLAGESLAVNRDVGVVPLYHPNQIRVFDRSRWTDVGLDFWVMPTFRTIRPR